MKYDLYGENGELETVDLPSHRIVCPRCDGRGVHDCWEGGMTSDEMAEQGPEFAEDYYNGVYDTRCTECRGRNVIEVVDRDAMSPELLARYDQSETQLRQWEYEMSMDY